MVSRIASSIKWLIAVSAAYFVYSLLLVRYIEPSIQQRAAVESPMQTVSESPRQAQLRSIFPPGSWELDEPKVLETENGMLLLKELREVDEYRLEMKPCTLVLLAGEEDQQQRRVVLQASESAVLTFQEPLNLARGQIGRLDSASLLGTVTIRSPESQPGADDALEISTHTVQLTAERIAAPEAVEFQYGRHAGRGRNLVITLDPANPPRKPKDNDKKHQVSIGQFRSLELTHVDFIRMQLKDVRVPGAPGPDSKQPQSSSERRSPAKMQLQVTCDGPFRYDFQQRVASFQDQVRVVRRNLDGPDDQLSCDTLSAHFAAGRRNKDAPSKNDLAARSGLSGLEVERIEAVGSPVVVNAPSFAAWLEAEFLEYNFKTKQVRIEDSDTATLRYQQNEVQTPRIEYQFGEEGRLGQLRADGPGRLMGTLPDDPSKTFEALWNKRVVLQPHEGEHALSLISGAVIRVADTGQFSANNVHLWLREVPLPRSKGGKQKYEYQPTRMLAEENVRIDSQPLSGSTGRAEVWIRYQDPVKKAAQPRGSHPQSGFGAKTPVGTGQTAQQQRGRQRFSVAGQHLQAQLIRSGEEILVEHLIIDQNVRFREIQTDRPGEIPLNISGDIVQVDHANTPHARVRVQGRQAEVAARGLVLVGGNIQLNRAENRVWIAGPGRMVLPAADPAPDTPAPETDGLLQGLKPAGPISVTWGERMDFDGLNARFHRDITVNTRQVSATGDVSDLLVRGDHLRVALTQRVDFSKEKQDPDLNVREMKFDGPVVLQNHSSRSGQRTSVDEMHVRDLTIDGSDGQLLAYGPGWGSTVRYNEGWQDQQHDSPPPQGLPREPGLIYVRVDFDDQVTGNFENRQVEFSGRVNTIYGPVADWRQTLDPDPPGGLGAEQYLLSSDRLSVVDMGSSVEFGPSGIGLEAIGNATIEGRSFSANGQRISYARAKELVILEGDGYTDAQLWLKGSTTPDAAAQQIRYWARTGAVQVDGANYLNLGQVGGASNR